MYTSLKLWALTLFDVVYVCENIVKIVIFMLGRLLRDCVLVMS